MFKPGKSPAGESQILHSTVYNTKGRHLETEGGRAATGLKHETDKEPVEDPTEPLITQNRIKLA